MSDDLICAGLLLAALALPFACAALARILGRSVDARARARVGLAVGLFGPLAITVWTVYGLLSRALGLSSLLTVLACLAVSVFLGYLWGRTLRVSLSELKKTSQ